MVEDLKAVSLDDRSSVKDILQQAKVKATLQRINIVKILLSAKSSMTAFEIERQSIELNMHVQLTTIYSTLKLLLQAGLVQKFYLKGEQSFFSLRKFERSNITICRSCGKKENVYLKDFTPFLTNLCEQQAIHFETHELVLTIKCAECLEQ